MSKEHYAEGVISSLRHSAESLVMPKLEVLRSVMMERVRNIRDEDKQLEIEQERLVSEGYAAAARLFITEMPIDAIDIPRSAPYLAIANNVHDRGDESDEH